jgi:hypothetical protein
MMQPGKYYIGDLCYVFNDTDWQNVCSLIIEDQQCLQGEFNLSDGRRFALFNTRYGDGEYKDQKGHRYSVDAGVIGCTLVENCSGNKYNDPDSFGRIVEFTKPFEVRSEDGIITIGNVVINTGCDYDDDDEDYDGEVFDDWDKD